MTTIVAIGTESVKQDLFLFPDVVGVNRRTDYGWRSPNPL